MPFLSKSEATKRSRDRKENGKCTNATNRRSRVGLSTSFCTILASMDVTSLYTNIPQVEEITTVCKAYEDVYKKRLPIPAKFLRRMLCLILKENSFQFNRRHYPQTHGTAMGTKMALAFANIFMAKIEKGIISKSIIKPLVWKRYIDNVFFLWDTNEDNIKEFVTRANHYHDTIKFTAEISDSEIAFLDTKVYKGERFNRDSTLDVQTHYKQTETFKYTNFYSSTRRKERIHKRRGAAPPKNKFITLNV